METEARDKKKRKMETRRGGPVEQFGKATGMLRAGQTSGRAFQ